MSHFARMNTNHVDFEPIYIYIETYRKSSMPAYFNSGSFGRKPLYHVIASQFKVEEAWVRVLWGKPRERPVVRCHRLVSGSFGRKPRSHAIVGLKGDIVRKTVLISKTPTS